MDNIHSSMIVLPELFLAVSAFVLLLVGLMDRTNVTRIVTFIAILALVVVGAALGCEERLHFNLNGALPVFAFGDMFVDDGLARFVKLLLIIAAAFTLLLSSSYLEKEDINRPEFPVLILFATLGMMLMVSAANLMALYVGLELQSLPLYVLAAFKRDDARSTESGLKYFVLGSLSSGIILYGISLIYGFAGTTEYARLAIILRDAPVHHLGIMFGIVFITAAMAFKVSAVPFHMWTPDVYEGAPTPVTAFFASAPKIAALILLTRLLYQTFGFWASQWDQIVIFMSVASMVLGSFAGVVQSNIKRLMAYSSIANVGYVLAGLATADKAGVQAALIYLAIYFINTLGVFGVILCLRRKGQALEKISDFSGLAKTHPLLALAMMIFMFSLAAVPPLAGFFGKYMIFMAVVKMNMVPLAIIGVLTSVVSAFYYLRLVKVIYFDEPNGEALDPLPDWGARAAITLAAVYMLVFTVWPTPVVERALAAVHSFIPS